MCSDWVCVMRHEALVSSEATTGLGFMIRFASLDKPVVPAGVRVLAGCVRPSLLLPRVVEHGQFLWCYNRQHWCVHRQMDANVMHDAAV